MLKLRVRGTLGLAVLLRPFFASADSQVRELPTIDSHGGDSASVAAFEADLTPVDVRVPHAVESVFQVKDETGRAVPETWCPIHSKTFR